jgi:hypothetical protein
VIYEVHHWYGLRWHDTRTKFHEDRFGHSGNIQVITPIFCGVKVFVLVLLICGLWFVPSRWPLMAWHKHTKFHDDWFRNSSKMKGVTSAISEAVVLVQLTRGIFFKYTVEMAWYIRNSMKKETEFTSETSTTLPTAKRCKPPRTRWTSEYSSFSTSSGVEFPQNLTSGSGFTTVNHPRVNSAAFNQGLLRFVSKLRPAKKFSPAFGNIQIYFVCY